MTTYTDRPVEGLRVPDVHWIERAGWVRRDDLEDEPLPLDRDVYHGTQRVSHWMPLPKPPAA